jgi:hypothetical protein
MNCYMYNAKNIISILKIVTLSMILSSLLFISSCTDEHSQPEQEWEEEYVKNYIHIGHPRTNDSVNQSIRADAATINYDSYDATMLGGDMLYYGLRDSAALDYLDSIFDLEDTTTFWALGNHDNGNGIPEYNRLDLLKEYTGRADFYSTTVNNITFLVLNTQHSYDTDMGNNFIGEQLKLIQDVTDTLTNSDALIILTHKLVWVYDDGDYQKRKDEVLQVGEGTHISSVSPSNFYEDVYPLLIKVKNRGVKVVCIGGDIGNSSNAEDFTTEDGIHLLASGIGTDPNLEEDRILIMKHNTQTGELLWEHVLMANLISTN